MIGAILYALIIYPARILMKLGWFRWRIEGLENLPPRQSGGMVLVMNHVNWLDILAIGALMPFSYRLSWLGKSEIFEHPAANWFFRTLNVIPIQRGKRDLAALEVAEKNLRDGAILMIFPEGHRSVTGMLQQGHGGAVRLALRGGATIIPAAITGSHYGLKGSFQRKQLLIRIGMPYTLVEPTPGNKISARAMNFLTTDMMVRIASLLPEANRGHYQSLVSESRTASHAP